MGKKDKSIQQVIAAQKKAVRFAEDVLQDSSKAAELESLSPEEYAERRHIRIINPQKRRRLTMARRLTRAELEDRVVELEDRNSDLQEKLDAIAELTADDEDEDGDEDDEDEAEYE